MAEPAFNDPKMTLNAFQDPMGNDAHQGLDNFLKRFHQPGVPSHTIITDPEYFVFLWFHNANGDLIQCPYTRGENYKPRLNDPSAGLTSLDFDVVNRPFNVQTGIQGGTEDKSLQDHCFDLTPFVRAAQLPDISPAGGTKIKTLFGETTAGSFSPYASDGSKSITLQMLDTEYSILDAIFYPWMKDINSPWWYRPEHVYDKWATPYPMATLEVHRPRMRYSNKPQKVVESRKNGEYTYYSYRFLGIKPTSYSSFEVNGAGPSNLLRSLTLICDICLVDVLHDAHITSANSINLGNRTEFIFPELPQPQNDQDDDNNPTDDDADDVKNKLDQANDDLSNNDSDIKQQSASPNADQPGEDEPEATEDGMTKHPEEYADPHMGNESDLGVQHEHDPEQNQPKQQQQPDGGSSGSDEIASHSNQASVVDEVKDRQDKVLNARSNADLRVFESDISVYCNVFDELLDIGKQISNKSSTKYGWISQDDNVGLSGEKDVKSLGIGIEIKPSMVGIVNDTDKDGLNVVNVIRQNVIGPASSIVSTIIGVDRRVVSVDKLGNQIVPQQTFSSSAFGISGNIQRQLNSSSFGNEMIDEVQEKLSNSLFKKLSRIIYDERKNSTTAFGVVSCEGSNIVGLEDMFCQEWTSNVVDYSTMIAGVVDSKLRTAFPAIGEIIGNASDTITNITLRRTSSEVSELTSYGIVKQYVDVSIGVRQMNQLMMRLNQASENIVQIMQLVGEVAQQILVLQDGDEYETIGNLGKVVKWMTNCIGNKQTPIETYVSLLAGKNINELNEGE